MKELTPRLEDVMMALWEMEQNQKVVRVKDLERFFDIRTSSAIDFIHALERRHLLHHEKYGYIELTDKGQEQARGINAKRMLLRQFFLNVLLLDPCVAEREACSFEHHVHKDTQRAMERLIAFFEGSEPGEDKPVNLFRSFCEKAEGRDQAERIFPLSDCQPPGTYLIEEIRCDLRRRPLFEQMALRPGTLLQANAFSPLGDPLSINVQGSHELFISLKDASQILVRKTADLL